MRVVKNCEICGKEFVNYKYDKDSNSNRNPRFCSKECFLKKVKYKDLNEYIFCKCGCGQKIKRYDKWKGERFFVHGHSNRGKIMSLDTRKKLSDAKNLHRKKIGICSVCGKNYEFYESAYRNKKRMVCSNRCRGALVSKRLKGIPKSDDHKQKIRESALKQFENGMPLETKLKIKVANKGKPKPEGFGEKISKSNALRQKFPFKNTSIELAMQNELGDRNISFEIHKPIFGAPDIFIEPNICIFCDGDYYHGSSYYFSSRRREEVYNKTQLKVKKRENIVNNILREQDYLVLRYFEHEIKSNVEGCIDEIEDVMFLNGGEQIGS